MTTNPTPIPEPTSPTAVAIGKRDGKPVVAARMDDDDTPWAMQYPDGGFQWCSWEILRLTLTDIRVVPMADLAAKPKPGPWLRRDELQAAMPTLKAGDVVEVNYEGHTATGKLWPEHGCLVLWVGVVRTATGKPGAYVDALRIIERAPEPEPGADIPDEVVEAAWDAFDEYHESTRESFRAALAAADAKRAELAGGEQA